MAILGHLGHIGSFWIILGHFGPFWAILGHFGPFWGIWGHFEAFGAICLLKNGLNGLESKEITSFMATVGHLGHFGSLWSILGHVGPFWGIWGHRLAQEWSEWSGIKLNHFFYGHSRIWAILGHFETFGAILNYLKYGLQGTFLLPKIL